MPKARPRRIPPMRGPRPRRRPDRGSTPPQQVQAPAPVAVLVPEGRGVVTLPRTIQVGELAKLFELSVVDVIRALVNLGLMVTINQTIDYDTAALVAGELGIEGPPQEEAAEEIDPRNDAPDKIGRRSAGTNASHESPAAMEALGDLVGVESDGNVKISKEKN